MADKFIARARAYSGAIATRVAGEYYFAIEEICELSLPYAERKAAVQLLVAEAAALGVDVWSNGYDYDKGMFLADVLYQWTTVKGNLEILQLLLECGLDPSTTVHLLPVSAPLLLAAALSGNADAVVMLRASPKFKRVPDAHTYIDLLKLIV